MKDKFFYFNIAFFSIVLLILIILSAVLTQKEEFVEIYWEKLPEKIDEDYTLNFYVKSNFKRELNFKISIFADENLEKSYDLTLKPEEKVLLTESIKIPVNSTEIKVMISPPSGKESYINYWIT